MKKWKLTLRNVAFSLAGATIGTLAGLGVTQKILLSLANRQADDTPYETYSSPWANIAYTKTGVGSPILLLHSVMLGASKAEFNEPLIAMLSKKHTVYAMDLVGFGQSEKPPKPWTAYQHAQAIHCFIQDVIASPVAILGANGGADIALTVSRLHANMVEKLYLISPEGFARGFATPEETTYLNRTLTPLYGTQKFLSATSKNQMQLYLENYFFANEKITPNFVKQHLVSARAGGSGAQSTFAMLQTGLWRTDSLAHFLQLSIPCVVLWGEENTISPPETMQKAQTLKPNCDYIIIEQTGALPHLEGSRTFIKTLQDYL